MTILVNFFCTLSLPISVIIITILAKNKKKFRQYLWLFIYSFAMAVYCYSPIYENDLFRYYIEIDRCSNLPFSQAFTWANDGLVVKNFIFWVLGKIQQKNLLQAITVGALYGTVGYISCDLQIKNEKFGRSFLVVLFLLPLHLITNNIRNMLAFSLSILGIYRDLVNKKRGLLTISLYIVPCFIHMASLVLLAERLLLPIIKKHYKFGAMLVVGIPLLIVNIYPILRMLSIGGPLGKIIERAIWKSYSTIQGTSAYAISTHESGYNNACRVVMLIFCFLMAYICFKYLREVKEKRDKLYDLVVFDFMLCIFTCVYNLTGAIKYWVFAVATVICGIPLISYQITGIIKYRFFRIDVKQIIIILAILRFLLELYYMSSRINYSEFFYNFMTQNAYTILYKIASVLI